MIEVWGIEYLEFQMSGLERHVGSERRTVN